MRRMLVEAQSCEQTVLGCGSDLKVSTHFAFGLMLIMLHFVQLHKGNLSAEAALFMHDHLIPSATAAAGRL